MKPIPTLLLDSLKNIPDFDETAFIEAHVDDKAIVSVRVNSHKPVDNIWQHPILNNVTNPKVAWCKEGIYLPERPLFVNDPAWHAGAYYVQEASSMFIQFLLENLVPISINKIVLDACAAPGGKSTLLSHYFNDGLVISNEVIKSRAAILVENTIKWGDTNTIITNNDPAHFGIMGNFFDVVLVDAPCSGSGLFRKQPEAIDEWSTEAVNLCSLRQQRILTDLLPALKEDGILLYATCSYSMEENEAIIDWLIDANLVEPIAISVPENWQITTSYSPKNGAACFRFFPHKTMGEGFFVAALRKKTAAVHFVTKEQNLVKPDKKELAKLIPYLPENKNLTVFQQSGITRVIDNQFEKELTQMAAYLYIKKAGNALGSFKGNDFIPNHEWAVSTLPKLNFPINVLNHTEAIQFLKRQDFMPEAANNKGWHLATYCGLPLGWMKVLPNRMNNYYPNEWRILKG